jgi:alpha-beta hydrolase superfamily lysophospholipase
MTATLYVGWSDDLLPDASLNFQINRWAAYGGPRWLDDVRPVLSKLASYPAWIDTFMTLGERALAEGRPFHAAFHFRSAEFFMTSDDPRKQPTRMRLLPLLRAGAGVDETARRWIPFDGVPLPAWHFVPERSKGTFVVFGGYDSYIEEFFPMLSKMRDDGWTIVAFEGPGQGTPLEESKTVMTPDWDRPVAAVLDAFGLDDVTLLGISLGGCLVIRAAANEPRVRRVIACDVLTDFYAALTATMPPALRQLADNAVNADAQSKFDLALHDVAAKSPILEWGLKQGQHVFGCKSSSGVFVRGRDFHTRDVSPRIRQDVLLMAGTHDHAVPREQVFEQGRLLSAARSTTIRIFTEDEYAQMHCQLGNFPLLIKVMESWAEERARAEKSLSASP